jgi:hypothetical protein
MTANGKSLTANLLTSEKQIKVIRTFNNNANGIIKTPLCYQCESSELIITSQTKLFLRGIPVNLEDLLKLTLSERSKNIKIQYYRNNMSVNYILWGESELDKRLLQ